MQTDISAATAKGSGDDTCVLPYSSGTTGLPKGTMLTHDSIVANLLQVRPAVMLSVTYQPQFHDSCECTSYRCIVDELKTCILDIYISHRHARYVVGGLGRGLRDGGRHDHHLAVASVPHLRVHDVHALYSLQGRHARHHGGS